jgi:hypothetical protein
VTAKGLMASGTACIAEHARVRPASTAGVSTDFYTVEVHGFGVNPLRRKASGSDRRSNGVRRDFTDVLVASSFDLRKDIAAVDHERCDPI